MNGMMLSSAGGFGGLPIVLVYIALFGALYFFMIRPQKKQEKEKAAMLATLAVGDTVLTSSGFYGVVIDINGDTVIVEFGYNKNCRIPLQRAAIIQIEKPEDAEEKSE